MQGTSISQERDKDEGDARSLFISKLRNALSRPINTSKAPSGFGAFLERPCDTVSPRLRDAFLQADKVALLALFLSRQKSQLEHLSDEDLEAVENLPDEDLKLAINEIIDGPRHESIDTFLNHYFVTSQRSKSNKGLMDSHKRISPATTSESRSTTSHMAKRPRNLPQGSSQSINEEQDMREHSAGIAPFTGNFASMETVHHQEHFGAEMGAEQPLPHFEPLHGTAGFNVNYANGQYWPFAAHLPRVFPFKLTRMTLKRADHTAWVGLNYSNPDQSELQIFVAASETRLITQELFDVHLIEEFGRRRVLLENGVSIEINGTFKLSGALVDRAAKLLGPIAAQTYQYGMVRSEEISKGNDSNTDCLNVEVWPDVNYPSLLTLKGDVHALGTISGLLWPRP